MFPKSFPLTDEWWRPNSTFSLCSCILLLISSYKLLLFVYAEFNVSKPLFVLPKIFVVYSMLVLLVWLNSYLIKNTVSTAGLQSSLGSDLLTLSESYTLTVFPSKYFFVLFFGLTGIVKHAGITVCVLYFMFGNVLTDKGTLSHKQKISPYLTLENGFQFLLWWFN